MTQIDVIMLACSRDDEMRRMTQAAIDSLHASSHAIQFNVILMESFGDAATTAPYAGAQSHFLPGPFHYNKSVNHGLALSRSDILVIANNDLIFHYQWLETMLQYEWDSASPIAPGWPLQLPFLGKAVYGYGCSHELAGWCIVVKRSALDAIGGRLDEQFDFYAQDMDYGNCLREKGLKHALIGTAYVLHRMHGTSGGKQDPAKLADARVKIDAKWLAKYPNQHCPWLDADLKAEAPRKAKANIPKAIPSGSSRDLCRTGPRSGFFRGWLAGLSGGRSGR